MSRVFDNANTPPNDNHIHTSTSAPINTLQALTLAAWIFNTDNSVGAGTIAAKDPGVYSPFLYNASGQINAQVSGSVTPATGAANITTPLNVWTHVAMTFDFAGDKKVHIYLNGTNVDIPGAPAIGGTVVSDSADGFWFGNDGAGNGFTGDIAEVVEYNTALTAPQIAALAASTTGATAVLPGNIVGYWHLNGTASPEPDSSGNGNAGVLSANPPIQGPNSPGYTPPPALINLLSNATVAVSAGSTIVNVGNTVLNGDLDLSPGSVVSGFPPGVVLGTQHIDDATAVQSQLDLTTAYNQAAAASGASTIATALDAVTLNAGVYNSAAGTFSLSGGTLTLDAQGNANAVWIFQMATTLITSGGSVVQVINGGTAKNVFWQVGSSASIGATNTFLGTILAAASITVAGTGTTIAGGLLASAAVNLSDTIVTPSSAPATFSISGSLGPNGAGATVSFTGPTSGFVIADGSGNFIITGLANGVYTITVTLAGFIFHPASIPVTVSGANVTGVNFSLPYSEPDCRIFGNFPNLPINVQGTLTYTVPSVDSRVSIPVDSRVSVPVDSRVSPNTPENSRTPGLYGPGEN